MRYKRLHDLANEISRLCGLMKTAGRAGDSENIEGMAKEIEADAGSIVAAMQIEGIEIDRPISEAPTIYIIYFADGTNISRCDTYSNLIKEYGEEAITIEEA